MERKSYEHNFHILLSKKMRSQMWLRLNRLLGGVLDFGRNGLVARHGLELPSQ